MSPRGGKRPNRKPQKVAATRSYGALLTAVPGLMVDNTVNNGAMTTPFMTFFSRSTARVRSRK